MAENSLDPNDNTEAGRSTRATRLRILPVATILLILAILSKTIWLVSTAMAQVPSVSSAANHALLRQAPANSWGYQPPPVAICKPDPLANIGDTKILFALHERQLALKQRAAALDRKQILVTEAGYALRKQIAALKVVEAKLIAIEGERDAADSARWHALVATYEAMEPRDAARIFDQLDGRIVLHLLERMNSRKSAAILAAMTPDKARSATEKLAGIPSSNAGDPLIVQPVQDAAP